MDILVKKIIQKSLVYRKLPQFINRVLRKFRIKRNKYKRMLEIEKPIDRDELFEDVSKTNIVDDPSVGKEGTLLKELEVIK